MIDDLVLNLTTLGKLRQDDKLSVHYGRLYIAPYTYTRALRRKFTGQNRYDVITFIGTTTSYSLAYAKSITNRLNNPNVSHVDGDLSVDFNCIDITSRDE